MATPEPEDVRMRADLAMGAAAEGAARVEDFTKQRVEQFDERATPDIYRLLARLAEGLGDVAMALKLIEQRGR